MSRQIHLHMDDSDTELITFMTSKLYQVFDKIHQLRYEDEEGNQLLILHYIDKSIRYKRILDHLRYN